MVININQKFSNIDNVSLDLVKRFIEPYKENCKYLKQARFQFLEPTDLSEKSESRNQEIGYMQADFSIPESCYIADTGHFNSVEFNICYNQLFYLMIAYLVQNKLFNAMADWDLETYKYYQLSNFLISRFSSVFRKPINSDNFQGTLSIHKYSTRRNLIMLKTSCAFYDQNDGWAEGDINIAVLSPESEKSLNETKEAVVN
ncbi:FcoT family thioesterase [Okeania sp. SIO3B5]|uniref:FcoT family thioesterase n=1 Tax=Okeania sp. SIO3B5 TaxID=2607811 RepID=UPI0025DF9575|nr:FcoT family thioesterase [Okeania sp. SIO3B5]